MTKSVSIESGALRVLEPDASGVRIYKGIPYAAPLIRPLRWRPPEPVAAWTGVRPTQDCGGHSVQGVVWDDIDLNGGESSGDCLYLKVWTPAAAGTSARRRRSTLRRRASCRAWHCRNHHASGNYGLLDPVAVLNWGQAQHRRLRRRSRQGHDG